MYAAFDQVGPALEERMTSMTKMTTERFREISEKLGFNYGPTFSIIKEMWQRGNEGLCLIDISGLPAIQAEAESHVVHPCILDACLQSCFIPIGNFVTEDTSLVPVGFKSIALRDVPSTKQLYCHVTADMTTLGKFDVTLMTPSGKVLLTIRDFRATELNSTERRFAFDELAYEEEWMEEVLQRKRETTRHPTCIVLKDSSVFSDALITRLQAAEANVLTVDLPNAKCFNTEAEKAITATFSGIPPDQLSNLRVVNTWPVETNLLPDNFDAIDQCQRLALGSSVFVLKMLIKREWLNSRVFFVTERTQLLNDCPQSANTIPWSSSVWGFRRTARLEHSDIRMVSVDLSDKEDMHEVDSLAEEILGESIEEEVAFRNGKRFINRMVRTKLSPEKPANQRIESMKKGSLYLSCIPSSTTLCLREKSLWKPSHSELTMDLLYCWTPSESLIDVAKPKGCVFVVGKVTGLPEGSEKSHVQIGDEVCGVVASGRVSPSLTIQFNNVFVKPTGLTKKQAAYIPACLALASYCLRRVASGKEHQSLLIHEANRGPGPAAVALAKILGHRVFCTISDTCQASAKNLLRDFGAESVVHQGSCCFNDESCHSLDAVIFFYPPAPNAVQESCHSLKRGGKVVILSSEFTGDLVFAATTNVKYEREDMADILKSPKVYEKLSLASLDVLEGNEVLGKLLAVQHVCIDLATAVKVENTSLDKQSSPQHQIKASSSISFQIHAFPSSGESSDLNKIPVLPIGLDDCGLKENRTYLVAGGIRGYGFEVACWMVENGAKSIGLLGRSKPSDTKWEEVRRIERRTGAKMHMFQVNSLPLSFQISWMLPTRKTRLTSVKVRERACCFVESQAMWLEQTQT